uniref:Putative retrotransposon protein n=1 Tax=Tanacetum cinerariifolium TaxID=118510 RepID=A0A6L2MY32_TANCI|nr:putative retrotransposon protein [Tanacetum cinerariifolium]
MDVKTSFLNGYLNEDVYMEQPEGFVNQKFLNRVCKLKHSIYQLKQPSRQRNKRFDDEIKKFRFSQNHDEPCVYVKASGSYVTFLIMYIDDILIMGNNIPMLQDVKSHLGRCFAMKDLGEAAYWNIVTNSREMPSWREIVSLTVFVKLASFTGDMKRELRVSCYTDAGYLTDADDMKSQTRYAGKARSKIRKFIFRLVVVPTIEEPINMYCDNTRAITIAKDHGATKGARYFRAKVHYLRETIEMGDVKIEKVDTYDKIGMIPTISLV